MNRRGIFVLLVFLSAIVTDWHFVVAEGEPRAVVSPPSWDFGYLPQKSEVSHVYYLKNTGATPLTVKKIKSGCSCTSVSKLEEPIPPGDSAAITVTYKSGRYHHRVKKTSTIYLDGPDTPTYHLRLLAYVFKIGEETRGVNITPPKLTWDVEESIIISGEDTLIITNLRPLKVQLAVLQSADDLFEWILPPDSIGPNEEAELVLRPTKQAIKDKITGASITIGLIHGDTTIATVPLKIKM